MRRRDAPGVDHRATRLRRRGSCDQLRGGAGGRALVASTEGGRFGCQRTRFGSERGTAVVISKRRCAGARRIGKRLGIDRTGHTNALPLTARLLDRHTS